MKYLCALLADAHVKPLLDQVDAIDQAVTDLEKLVHAMDDYTLRLGVCEREGLCVRACACVYVCVCCVCACVCVCVPA